MAILDEIDPLPNEQLGVGRWEKTRKRWLALSNASKWLLRLVSLILLIGVLLPAVIDDLSNSAAASGFPHVQRLVFVGYPLLLPLLFAWWGRFKPSMQVISLIMVGGYFFFVLIVPKAEVWVVLAYGAVFVSPIVVLAYVLISVACYGENMEKLNLKWSTKKGAAR